MGRPLETAIAIITIGVATAHAEPVKVRVEADGVPAWQAEALGAGLEGAIELDRYRAVEVAAELAPGTLRWTIVVAGAALKRGEMKLAGTDVATVAGTLRSEINRVMQPGEHTKGEPPATVGAPPGMAALGLVAVAVFLLVPFAVARPKGVGAMRSFRRVVATSIVIGGAAAAIATLGDQVPGWVVMIGGGLAWGSFAAVILPVMFPALPGLDRVEHSDLLRVLGRWSVLALQRVGEVALVLAPFVAAQIGVCVAIGVDVTTAVLIIAPAWALCVRLWIQAWVEIAAGSLDRELVIGEVGEDNAWHAAVKGYFMGYARRVGWTTDDRLVENIRFLPGKTDDVITYGGGTTPTRIVIPRPMLEMALAPYGRPHDYAAPRVSTLHWTLWNQGLVVPTEVGAPTASREQRQPRTIAIEGDVEAMQLGEVPTLAGYVEPASLDARTAFRPQEDPLWLDFDVGEEFDGTDAGDKDFLFGLLVHELGRIRRHEDRRATLGLVVRRWVEKRPRLAKVVAAIAGATGRAVTPIGHAHVTLNFARDHYVQYLAWRLWRREDLLTARAYAPELERQTEDIARTVEQDASGDAALRGRLAALTRATIPSGRARLVRRLAFAAAVLAAIGGIAVAVFRAIDYHPTYEARIKEQKDGQGK
jgi:hypothetical protein